MKGADNLRYGSIIAQDLRRKEQKTSKTKCKRVTEKYSSADIEPQNLSRQKLFRYISTYDQAKAHFLTAKHWTKIIRHGNKHKD